MFNKDLALKLAKYSALAYETGGKHLRFSRGSSQALLTYDKELDAIVLAFRGTAGLKDIKRDLTCLGVDLGNGMKVHRGFYMGMQRIIPPLKRAIGKMQLRYGYPRIYVTGHSLGGVEAQLFGLEICQHHPIVYTFGAPKLGNKKFKDHYDELVPRCFAVKTDSDIVPKLPRWFKSIGKSYYLLEDGDIRYNPSRLKVAMWYLLDWCRSNDHFIGSYIRRLKLQNS